MKSSLPALLKQPLRLSVDNLTDHMWGGNWIPRFKRLSAGASPVGEAWELSMRAEHPSYVETESARFKLADLVRENPVAMLGAGVVAQYGPELPLLLKFIDAADDLSVQVHPSDDHMPPGQCGKAEAWRVIDVQPGSENGFVYLGFDARKAESYDSPEAFSEAFFAALSQANAMGPSDDPLLRERAARVVLPFLNKIRVNPGDVFDVRPGVIHAVGRGVRLFEIQQPSDTTYRVWDWNRPDAKERAQGRVVFRSLHTQAAARVLDMRASDPAPVVGMRISDNEQLRVRETNGRFELSEFQLTAPRPVALSTGGAFQALTVIEGAISVDEIIVDTGRTVFIPASLPAVHLSAERGPATVLRSTVPL
jgi:mannose-6-phosphate isomerase